MLSLCQQREPGRSIITIHSASDDDIGRYSCEAHNDMTDDFGNPLFGLYDITVNVIGK